MSWSTRGICMAAGLNGDARAAYGGDSAGILFRKLYSYKEKMIRAGGFPVAAEINTMGNFFAVEGVQYRGDISSVLCRNCRIPSKHGRLFSTVGGYHHCGRILSVL